ncbi:MAG: DUF4352 domain-containing protein [Candidatus Marinimicrobia bacterium]|jgi:hypothetical protein|nr:DUF4352 domain-containing protein [Candidatus Neomarinimicrobiota bacterium]MBT3937893.1 DUF4352 domain-containing protein [Candidatus Neomarinimicrobiota bacterium]MBT3961053.1 DUF4352 domain-containing protein [Candidatus Neomarinimicrobiota bacterium]MBT4383133.1 DUF4352 domain-containing protein [Candidatus Neomarinimicrobiota bacterium]MBT4635953.1 DUF4352 domain-containing protein [Candidatus Neomarinimicrobiota bacterium]
MQKIRWILLVFVGGILFGQTTRLKSSTDIFIKANENSSIGSLASGTQITKLKLDKSGKYVKATIEFYIPVNALDDGRVSLPIGTVQIAENVKYKLISAKKNGNQVTLNIKITNLGKKSFDFSAMTQIKLIGAGGNKAELNPFEGKNTVLFGVTKNKSINAELVYDFKKLPKEVEMVCSPKMKGGEKIFYQLGF